jgi:acetolactate synthase-1/2/3 large subunit
MGPIDAAGADPMQKPKESDLTGARVAARALKRHGVEVVFGQSIPPALMLAVEDEGILQYTYRAENAAGCMADGYARVSGRIGVVAAQNGPAATLLVAPLAEALKASVPVLALVQDISRKHTDRNAFQELDHLKLFDSCAKWVRRVADVARVEDYTDMAITAATSGRPGPAVLLFPADLLDEAAAPTPFHRRASLGTWPLDRPLVDAQAIETAAALIAAAENPIVIAGGGVHGARACRALSALQEQAHVPVAYTPMGKGSVSDAHALTLGLIGSTMGVSSIGHYLRPLIEEADVVLLVGTRTNQNGTDSWTLPALTTKVIHLDIDPQEIGRTFEPSVRLVGDARAGLQQLLTALRSAGLERRAAARPRLEARIATAKRALEEATHAVRTSRARPIRPERVMHELMSVMDSDTIVVADASYSSNWVTACLSAGAGQRIITPRGLAGLGWGFPMALGAKVARPQSKVVCVVGDGGFGHCWAELETAARMGTAVTLIVLNNGMLGFQRDAETVVYGRHTSACLFKPVDHAAIARACGLEAHRIEDPEELAPRLAAAAGSSSTVLLEVIIDPQAFPPITLFDNQPALRALKS